MSQITISYGHSSDYPTSEDTATSPTSDDTITGPTPQPAGKSSTFFSKHARRRLLAHYYHGFSLIKSVFTALLTHQPDRNASVSFTTFGDALQRYIEKVSTPKKPMPVDGWETTVVSDATWFKTNETNESQFKLGQVHFCLSAMPTVTDKEVHWELDLVQGEFLDHFREWTKALKLAGETTFDFEARGRIIRTEHVPSFEHSEIWTVKRNGTSGKYQMSIRGEWRPYKFQPSG